MSIEITNDSKKMELIGEHLVAKHQRIYSPKMIDTLKDTVRRFSVGGDLHDEDVMKLLYRSVYDYWVYGNSCDEEFYYNFIDKSHEEKLEYMTFRLREKYCKHINPGDADVFVDKYKTYQKLKKYYLRNVIQICGVKDFPAFAEFVSRHKSFVVKPKDMAFGIGVYVVREGEYSDIQQLFERILESGRKNKEEVVWAKSDAIVLEEIIAQDEHMAVFHPASVNGVRVTTVKTDKDVTLLHPWFKIGANNQFVTSAVFGTMDACIHPVTGVVETNGFKENGESYECHPNTGVRILGFQIPRWDELVETAKKVAFLFPDINYVGWDFVLTPQGWCIMEANYDGDFMWQLCYGKGMRREFEDLIGWKMEQDFWWQ